MNEKYLWDRSGKKDEELMRLERLLASMRYREPVPKRGRNVFAWVAAAVAGAALAGFLIVPLLTRGALTDWRMAGQSLYAGQWIEASGKSLVKIESEKTGEVEIEPGSRFRLLAGSKDEEHFSLHQGTIHAFIWAPPGRFVVDTPSARTVDLGCRYTLTVSKAGVGVLTVQSGWVAFEARGVESFIPEGAACVTRPGTGPGTPYFTDAPGALIGSLELLDKAQDADALRVALDSARPRDALTLWHLLARTRGDQRVKVFDRFSALIPLPGSVSREAIMSGNPAAFDAAWNALNLGSTTWWREWKRQW